MRGLIRLVGPVQAIDATAEPIGLPGGRSKEILAALALAGTGTVSRDALAGRIWGSNGAEARKALNTSLWRLREVLKQHQCQHWIQVDGDHLRLDPLQGPEIDLARVDDADHAPDCLEETTQRILEILDSDEPELAGDLIADWLDGPRISFQQRLLSVIGDLAGMWGEMELSQEAVGLARRLVKLDPFDERGWRILIRNHLRNGNRALAIRRFREMSELFEDELGELPSIETEQLLKGGTYGAAPAEANFTISPRELEAADRAEQLSARISDLRSKILELDSELAEIGRELARRSL